MTKVISYFIIGSGVFFAILGVVLGIGALLPVGSGQNIVSAFGYLWKFIWYAQGILPVSTLLFSARLIVIVWLMLWVLRFATRIASFILGNSGTLFDKTDVSSVSTINPSGGYHTSIRRTHRKGIFRG